MGLIFWSRPEISDHRIISTHFAKQRAILYKVGFSLKLLSNYKLASD
jgi:hypothetical protein